MYKGLLSEDELLMLIGDKPELEDDSGNSSLNVDDRKLLHALVRNQLRLLTMIEELQSEVRKLKAASASAGDRHGTSIKLEPLPLPFFKQGTQSDPETHRVHHDTENDAQQQEAPAAEMSRKERFKKRRSLW